MDTLAIHNFELWTRIGVPDDERKKEQRILVSVSMSLDTSDAGREDDVKKSINYFDLSKDISELAKTERKTIERFADDIARLTLESYRPQSVTVTVTKFPLANAEKVFLTITRP